MTYYVPRKFKDEQLHIRIKPDVKNDLQILSDSRGLTMSSLVHSLIIQAIRAEKLVDPSLFAKSEREGNVNNTLPANSIPVAPTSQSKAIPLMKSAKTTSQPRSRRAK